jgi:polyvinyl alcohol dehydrogenase (cytochrome)
MRTTFLTLLLCTPVLATAQPAAPNPAELRIEQGLCTASAPLNDSTPQRWNGWGPGVTNTRFQPAEAGGITVADVPRLRLKWAYGLPNEQQPRGQPAVIGGRMFVGSQAGAVYALDAKTGCTIWQFFPRAGLRSATSVGPHRFAGGRSGYAVYFVDSQAHAYALDADSGEQIWMTRVEDHPMVRGTGAVTVYDGTVFVPMTGISEAMGGANPEYECCTFRGSMTALDAATGAVKWKTFTIPE